MCPHSKFKALGMSGQFSTMAEPHPQQFESFWPLSLASLFLPQSHLDLSLKIEVPP